MRRHICKVFLTLFLIGGLAALSSAAIRVSGVHLGKPGIVMPTLPGPRLPLTPFIHGGLKLTPTLVPIVLPNVTILAAGAAVNSVAIPVSAISAAPAVAFENGRSFKPAVTAKQIAGVGAIFGMKDGSVKANGRDSRSAFDGTKRGGTKTGELDDALVEDGGFSGSRPMIFRPARRVTLPTQDLEEELGIQGWD